MDSVRECLSCFDVQYRRLKSVRDRYGRIRFHRTRGPMQKLLITLKRQTLKEKERIIVQRTHTVHHLTALWIKKALKCRKNEKALCRALRHNTILLQTSPDNFLYKYEICMSFIKFSYQIIDDLYGLRGPLEFINLISTSAPSATQDRRLV